MTDDRDDSRPARKRRSKRTAKAAGNKRKQSKAAKRKTRTVKSSAVKAIGGTKTRTAKTRTAKTRTAKTRAAKSSAINNDEWPEDHLVVVAVRGMVLFPGVVLPVVVGRERSIQAIQAAIQAERPVGLLLQHDGEEEFPGPDELYRLGTTAEILRYVTAPDGTHHVIVQGSERFRVLEFVE
ncbi:MAG: LON peptidase substrate-binding domain-containing protein, partial [Planctomycetota bacterium]